MTDQASPAGLIGVAELPGPGSDGDANRFRALIEHSTDLILLLDQQGVALYQSPGVRVLGHGTKQLLGRNLSELVHPEDREHVRAAFARIVKLPRGQATAALRLAHADGYWVAVEASFTNLLEDPDVQAIVVNAREVTERVVAQEALQRSQQQLLSAQAQLLQAQKMEAIGRLAGGVAHDFNNLLAAILSGTELMLDSVAADSALRQDIEDIRVVARRGAALTRQLLTFSRKGPLDLRVVDLNEIVRGLSRMLARLLGSGVMLEHALDPLLDRVCVDPAQMEQVVMNLVVNARDAMPNGGTILIETCNGSTNDPGSSASASSVLLKVRDTGSGMDDQTMGRIFEPFFTTKEAHKGTGLGLATVYGIVKQSGGEVRVESELNKGTVFEISLPAALTEPVAGRPVPATLAQVRTGTILLVDDEAAVRGALHKLLTRSGFKVLIAGDGEEALRVATDYQEAIDLLITDLNMPGLGGHELAARLTARRPDLVVVFMSGLALGESEADQGTHFIEKPFDNAALLRLARTVLVRSQA